MNELTLPGVGRNRPTSKSISLYLIVGLMVVILLSTVFTSKTYAMEEQHIPMTGFTEFDAMYTFHMNQGEPLVDDIMKPVNNVIFFLIKLQRNFLASILLLLSTSALAFAILYVLKPEFADEISEVKTEVATGQTVPIDEPKRWVMQFLPDIKANSGIGDRYEFERPTMGMLVRDHLLHFILIFAVTIAFSTNTITTLTVKAGNAIAFGAKYYTDNTDFEGIVRTVTTAGKDFDPKYDTLTTTGRNKKKTFNAMHNALKDAKPRDRTSEFLGRIGTQVHNNIVALEARDDIHFDFENFSVTAEISPHDMAIDVSPIKTVIKKNLSDFGMVVGQDVKSNDYMYITILQYEEVRQSGYQSPTTDANAWRGGVGGTLPNGFQIDDVSGNKALIENQGYTFKLTANQVMADLTLSNGETKRVAARIHTGQGNKAAYITTKDLGSGLGNNVSIRRIRIQGINDVITLQKDGDIKPAIPSGSIQWSAN